jgi:excisionase family DNA binding protein
MNQPTKILNGFRVGRFLLDADTGELYENGKLCKRLRPQAHKLRGELAQLDTLLLCRLLEDKNRQDGAGDGDQLLSVDEAADRLGVSADYLYRHHKSLQFTRRVGRKLLFSAKGLEKYIAQKQRS